MPDVMKKNKLEQTRAEEEKEQKRQISKEIADKNHIDRVNKKEQERAIKRQNQLQETHEKKLQGDRNAIAFEAERDARAIEYRLSKQEQEKK